MVEVELLYVPGCSKADAARQLLNDCIEELGLAVHIEEKGWLLSLADDPG
jgi:hypothetical protein